MESFKKPKSNKKILSFLLVGILSIVCVSAYWMFFIEGSTVATVGDLSGYNSIELSIPNLNVNTSNGSASDIVYSNNFILNRNVTMNVSIDEQFTDSSGGNCSNGENDCTLTYKIVNSTGSYAEITNGSNIYLQESIYNKNVSVEMECVAYSCPQTRNITVTLIEA